MAIQLFIDTNAYLSFYHFTKDDIPDLAKLEKILTENKGILHLPEQVRDEWRRNRDSRLNTAAKEFQKTPFASEIPRYMQALQMAKIYAAAIAEAKKARTLLIAESVGKARTYQLEVDIVLGALFESCQEHKHDEQIFAAGKLRAERGNPPGKPDSIGDQYIWETLLAKVPDGDLYIVTKDGDYVSVLDGTDDNGMTYPNAFLKDEWQKRKKGSLYVFDSIKGFLNHYDKSIAVNAAPKETAAKMAAAGETTSHATADLSTGTKMVDIYFGIPGDSKMELSQEEQLAKEKAIHDLIHSSNFADTHAAVHTLTQYEQSFSKTEVNALFEAALGNSQVGWIIEDDDVNTFYLGLLSKHIASADPGLVDGMIELLGIARRYGDDGSEEAPDFL
jgi:hypothetical protein